ncbi:hypothetical protein BV20DRAFT_767226 [Pilatotrama ljubarskyi]|nr:hypothetical protein BV20DRAFT_767226 [Pilatotrama ljubarskyi]
MLLCGVSDLYLNSVLTFRRNQRRIYTLGSPYAMRYPLILGLRKPPPSRTHLSIAIARYKLETMQVRPSSPHRHQLTLFHFCALSTSLVEPLLHCQRSDNASPLSGAE